MAIKQKYVLGEVIPNSPHAVVSNLPTLTDVCAYEEKAEYVAEAMGQGYPRFVEHRWIQSLTKRMLADLDLPVVSAVVVRSLNESLRHRILGIDPAIHCHSFEQGVYGLAMDLFYFDPESDYKEAEVRLKAFVQHTGCRISSRVAEGVLRGLGCLEVESGAESGAEERINRERIGTETIVEMEDRLSRSIADLSGLQSSGSVSITASGMNAFYTAFKAMQSIQLARGRTQWLQLGWLYVDSGFILQKYLSAEETLSVEYAIGDTESILRTVESLGDSLSVVVLECPTNPFCEIADLKRIAEAVWAQGGLVLIDPSIVSLYNINCTPYADAVVTSLTKYAGHSGDILAGAVVLNEASWAYSELKAVVQTHAISLYGADLIALGASMRGAEASVERMNENTRSVVAFLKRHPKVKRVFAVSENQHERSYLKHSQALGSIVSFEVKGSMEAFYDHLQLVKGPSFGTDFTIVCPYFYLAHYDLVVDTSPQGLLNQLGIDRNTLRISVGCESVDSIIQALESAFSFA
ncbi:MAG: hypothetical protein CML12_03190 [Puniceicoccaceae bacterium]|nr:hypothetical protein [Puniceicoccaceae bacterium]